MIYIALNIWPIFAATAAGLVAGLLLLRLLGTALPAWPRAGIALVAEAWLAAILAGALILAPDEAPAKVMALLTPVVIWAGFVLPAIVSTHLLRGLGGRLAIADSCHWLLVMVVQAVVLDAIGLVPPPR
ncbi:hypothetical protein [Thermaurantiacus sp.]